MLFAVHSRPPSKLEACTAKDGLSAVDNSPVDEVISDLKMPGELDGLGLCWQMHKRAPGIAKTLMSGKRLASKVCVAPNTRFFAKPVPSDQLIEALADMLS